MSVASVLRPQLPMRRVLSVLALCVSLAVPTGLARAQTASSDIVDTAVQAGTFTTLATALKAAGLVETLKGPGPFTVFAPTDTAFAKLPAGTVDSLLANPDRLRAVLTYHVVAGRVTAADVVKLHTAATVQGEDLTIATSGSSVKINNASVVQPDIMASNGVIHVIDAVLLPPSIASAMTTDSSSNTATATDGQRLTDQSPAVQTLFRAVWGDRAASQWVTEHNAALTTTADIVDTAVGAGSFTTLATALNAAGLVDTLKGPGPFTVFAPTDAAFAKLPAGTLERLLANPDQLRAVLTYHVVAGADTAAMVSQMDRAATVQGENVAIRAANGKVTINDATVTQADVKASNGIIHVIDTVLLPPSIAAGMPAQ